MAGLKLPLAADTEDSLLEPPETANNIFNDIKLPDVSSAITDLYSADAIKVRYKVFKCKFNNPFSSEH